MVKRNTLERGLITAYIEFGGHKINFYRVLDTVKEDIVQFRVDGIGHIFRVSSLDVRGRLQDEKSIQVVEE